MPLRSATGILIPILVAGCVSASASPPADGQVVELTGELDFGYETRCLLGPNANVGMANGISLEMSHDQLRTYRALDGRRARVTGSYHRDLAGSRIMLGLCSEDGLRVASITPLN
jgi:hypothetical protein